MPRARNQRKFREKVILEEQRRSKLPPEVLAEEDRLRQEQFELRRAENARRAQKLTRGRPVGSGESFPHATVDALKALNYRVKRGQAPEAGVGAGYALERLFMVAGGRVSKGKAPSVLKAALAIREEICEPVVKEAHITGGVSLVDILTSVAVKVNEAEPGAIKALTPAPANGAEVTGCTDPGDSGGG